MLGVGGGKTDKLIDEAVALFMLVLIDCSRVALFIDNTGWEVNDYFVIAFSALGYSSM